MEMVAGESRVAYEPETGLDLAKVVETPNVAELLDEDYVATLGHRVIDDLNRDEETRSEWSKRYEQAMKLALQIAEEKTWPWPKASNVKFPLITIAALQYHARAYPSLISPNDVVRYQVFGEDPQGEKDKVGQRIAKHMNWQLTEEDEYWEEDTDKSLMIQPILGCVFKKTYYSVLKKKPVSELVLPSDFVVDYYTKRLDTCRRSTHLIELSRNDVRERIARELFSDVELGIEQQTEQSRERAVADRRQGIDEPGTDDRDRPYRFAEQHRWLDLDKDGYEEPYIVTVHRETRKVVRIFPRFMMRDVEMRNGKVLRINAENYFTKIPFIPSPDGGFYDLGFGMLLAPITDSVNTLMNQLIDAGTLQNLGGGFLGRGFKLKSGMTMFTPGEWKRADFSGEDISKAVLPLPTPQPSDVLFKMLSLLIEYGERTGGAVDVNVGVTPGQNTPAETSRNAMEAGLKVYSGIFKRTYRALRDEFRKLYLLNRQFLPELPNNPFEVTYKEYTMDVKGIRPAADPSITSDAQNLQRAEMMRVASQQGPGWDRFQVERRWAKALKIQNINEVLPVDQEGKQVVAPPPNPKMIAEETKQGVLQIKAKELDWKIKSGTAKLMQEAQKVEAQIAELEAKAVKHRAEAKGVETGHQLAIIDAELAISKEKHAAIRDSIRVLKEVGDSIHEQRTAVEGMGAASADKGVPGKAAA